MSPNRHRHGTSTYAGALVAVHGVVIAGFRRVVGDDYLQDAD